MFDMKDPLLVKSFRIGRGCRVPSWLVWRLRAVAGVGNALAPEHPVGEAEIAEHDGHDHGSADADKGQGRRRRGSLPQRRGIRHGIRPHTDAETKERQQKQRDRKQERAPVRWPGDGAPDAIGDDGRHDRHRRQITDIRPAEPAPRDVRKGYRGPDTDDADEEQGCGRATRAAARPNAAVLPVVLKMSHAAPSSQYPATRPRPQTTANALKKSRVPP